MNTKKPITEIIFASVIVVLLIGICFIVNRIKVGENTEAIETTTVVSDNELNHESDEQLQDRGVEDIENKESQEDNVDKDTDPLIEQKKYTDLVKEFGMCAKTAILVPEEEWEEAGAYKHIGKPENDIHEINYVWKWYYYDENGEIKTMYMVDGS